MAKLVEYAGGARQRDATRRGGCLERGREAEDKRHRRVLQQTVAKY